MRHVGKVNVVFAVFLCACNASTTNNETNNMSDHEYQYFTKWYTNYTLPQKPDLTSRITEAETKNRTNYVRVRFDVRNRVTSFAKFADGKPVWTFEYEYDSADKVAKHLSRDEDGKSRRFVWKNDSPIEQK